MEDIFCSRFWNSIAKWDLWSQWDFYPWISGHPVYSTIFVETSCTSEEFVLGKRCTILTLH